MIFHPKPVYRFFWRYIGLAFFIVWPIIVGGVLPYIDKLELQNHRVYFGVMGLVFFVLGLIIFRISFLRPCFASLYITKDAIIWRCPFQKTYRMEISECKYVGIEYEVIPNRRKIPFIYFTTEPYPEKFKNQIQHLKINNQSINFWYSKKLHNYLKQTLPANVTHSLTELY